MQNKKRRLSDLYRRGVEVSIDDGEGGVDVYVQKLSPHEQEIALRKASAARALLLMDRNDRTSERYLEAYAEVNDFGSKEVLVQYLALNMSGKKRDVYEAELGSAEEWSKDEYLQGLRDAWSGVGLDGGLDQRYAEDPEDPEAKRVFEELKRFADLVTDRLEAETAGFARDLDVKSEEELQHEAARQFLDDRANAMFMLRYSYAELFLAVKKSKEDRTGNYFANLEEVEDLEPQVVARLSRELAEISVDITEGKDSGATPDSSPSSEQPGEAETVESSGLVAVSP